jgi:hypothetical protein
VSYREVSLPKLLRWSSLAQDVLGSQELELAVALLVNRKNALAFLYVLTPPIVGVGNRAFHQTMVTFLTLPIYPEHFCHIFESLTPCAFVENGVLVTIHTVNFNRSNIQSIEYFEKWSSLPFGRLKSFTG